MLPKHSTIVIPGKDARVDTMVSATQGLELLEDTVETVGNDFHRLCRAIGSPRRGMGVMECQGVQPSLG